MSQVEREISGITDEELTALALAADPNQSIPEDAVPIQVCLARSSNPLPEWYMPMARARCNRWWRPVVFLIIASFVVIDACGLCGTFGQIVLA